MKPVAVYLAAFNFLSASLWLNVLIEGLLHLARGAPSTEFYEKIHTLLFITQHLAVFEIFHSMFGLVSSPLVATTIQVVSRVFMLDAFTFQAEKECAASFSFYLMIVSWACAEVPRYAFYFVSLILPPNKKVPYFLFFLRYSLFMVLYPTGITGELLQQVAAYPYFTAQGQDYIVRFSHIVIAFIYLPLGPFMIFNMWNMRKRATKKYFAVEKPSNGLVWPLTRGGERSTTDTAKKIFAAAAREGAPTEGLGDQVAKQVEREKNWRFGYVKHIKAHVELCLQDGVDTVQVARAGLQACYQLFRFAEHGNESQSFGDYVNTAGKESFSTGVLQGEKTTLQCGELAVPYKGKKLTGAALQAQLDLWVKRGTIEDTAGAAIAACSAHGEWLDLSDVLFVMLGASSAMGPLQNLLDHRATVVAIDLPRPAVWEKLFRETLQSNGGRLVFPFEIDPVTGKKQFGCDMLADPRRICTWLQQVVEEHGKGKQVVCGNYTYLDGALHVQLALAGDAIMQSLMKHVPNVSLAFLCTPTDDHIVEQNTVVNFAQQKLREPKLWWQTLFQHMGVLVPNYSDVGGGDFSVVDAIVSRQGPNYALAKRIQHWRALVARAEGHVVSSNIAPSTATQSVLSNPQFAAGYYGWKYFDPLEVFMQDTSGAVMFALMVQDLKNPQSKANPQVKLPHPLALFMLQSFHGGIWRAAYTVDSIGVPAAITYYLPKYAGMGVGVLGLVAAAVRYIAVGI